MSSVARRQLPKVNATRDPSQCQDGVSDWNVVSSRVGPPSAGVTATLAR